MVALDLSDHPDHHAQLDTWIGEFTGSPRYGQLEAFAYNKDGVTRAWAIKSAKRELENRPVLKYEWIPVEQLAERIGDMDVNWDRVREDARWDALTIEEIFLLREFEEEGGKLTWQGILDRESDYGGDYQTAFGTLLDRDFIEETDVDSDVFILTEDGESVIEHELYDGEEAIIDLSVPVIAAPTPEWGLLPIDGWHRIAKAKHKGIEALPVFVLTQDEDLRVQGLKARLLR